MQSEDVMKDNSFLWGKCSKFFTSPLPWMDLELIKGANQNRNQQQTYLLKSITHVMDCECFIIDGRVFYREISICDLNKNNVETYHLYDSSFLKFQDLNEKQRRCVIRQSSIHRMYY